MGDKVPPKKDVKKKKAEKNVNNSSPTAAPVKKPKKTYQIINTWLCFDQSDSTNTDTVVRYEEN